MYGNRWVQLCWLSVATSFGIFGMCFAPNARGQSLIVPDDTLGAESSFVIESIFGLPIEVIDGGAARGENLFHSFQEFNVDAGRSAFFFSPAGIENILTRVTGDNPSSIFGTLGTFGDAAPDLFFINPNGILFGPGARLDLEGSFLATTASGIQFGEQRTFSATDPAPVPLLDVDPSALFFNQLNPGAIAHQGSLFVDQGESLILAGGEIILDGGVLGVRFLEGGRIDLGAVAGVGTVELTTADNLLGLSVPEDLQRADVSLVNGSVLRAVAADGGDIAITGRDVLITEGSIVQVGSAFGLEPFIGQAGKLQLDASGTINLDLGAAVQNLVFPGEVGNSGNIEIAAESLFLRNNGNINASTLGRGNSGDVIIDVQDTVQLDGTTIFNIVGPVGEGNSGDITIRTGNLQLLNGGQVDASVFTGGQGNTGDITVIARDTVLLDGQRANSNLFSTLFSQVDEGAVGRGGNIFVTTDLFIARDGGRIKVNTEGQGDAGNIELNARSVFVTTGGQIDASTEGTGNAGNITINAEDQVLFQGVRADGEGTSVFTRLEEQAVGDGGNIEINARRLSILDGAQLQAQSLGQGNAGNIIINVEEDVVIDGFHERESNQDGTNSDFIEVRVSTILSSVEENGVGEGGDVRITASSLSLSNRARISSSTNALGDAGNILIQARESVAVDGSSLFSIFPSSILSTVGPDGVGNGGNITVDTGFLSLINGGRLSTATNGRGNAGNVLVNATDQVSLDSDAYIASVVGRRGQGEGGDIRIRTGSLDIAGAAQLDSSTFGRGNAGDVIIDARDTVTFTGRSVDGTRSSGILSLSEINSTGDGGDVQIVADALVLAGGAVITTGTNAQGQPGDLDGGSGGDIAIATNLLSLTNGANLRADTNGRGNAGNINITASERASLSNEASISSRVSRSGRGEGGDIQIQTRSLSLTNSAELDTSTFGQGNAGNIFLNIADDLTLDESFVFSVVDSPLSLFAGDGVVLARGDAGDIQIRSGSLAVLNGGQISTSTFGIGDAGNISIAARGAVRFEGFDFDNVIPSPSAIFSFVGVTGQGNGGNIDLSSDSLLLLNGSRFSASSSGQGNAGNINLRIQDRFAAFNANLLTSATATSGGAINVEAGNILLVGDSDIRTEVAQGAGGAGSITLTADYILAFDDSDILAFAQDGQGGNVTLNTPAFFGENYQPASFGTDPQTLDNNDRVDINASGAVAGVITLPDVSFIENSLTDLPEIPVNTDSLIAGSCIARSQDDSGTFVITGTGGLPVRPGNATASAYPTGDVRSVPTEAVITESTAVWQPGEPIQEPQGVYQLADGRLVMSRECVN